MLGFRVNCLRGYGFRVSEYRVRVRVKVSGLSVRI